MNKTITEATKILKEAGLEIKINNEIEGLNKDEVLVKQQTPISGIEVNKGSFVSVSWE